MSLKITPWKYENTKKQPLAESVNQGLQTEKSGGRTRHASLRH